MKELEREMRGHVAALSDATQELEELRKKSADFDLTRDAELSKLRRGVDGQALGGAGPVEEGGGGPTTDDGDGDPQPL